LEQGKTANQYGTTDDWVVEFSDVRSCTETGREVHLEISIEIEDSRHDDDELVDFLHGAPVLQRL
jgi:hypothetical protein